jgi:hypothetical protein
MIYQRALRKQAIHKRYVVGVHPIIQFFINKLKIEEIIGTYIKQDRRLKLSIETVLVVLIHNILSGVVIKTFSFTSRLKQSKFLILIVLKFIKIPQR